MINESHAGKDPQGGAETSCLGAKNILCSFMKPKSPEATRVRYKGILSSSDRKKVSVVQPGALWLPVSWDLLFVLRKHTRQRVMGYPSCVSDGELSNTSTDFSSYNSYSSVEQSVKEEAELVARAEIVAFEEEHNDFLTTIRFQIKLHVAFGEQVCIIGSVRELGDWDADLGALPLDWCEGDVWSREVTVKRACVPRLEYKYIVRSDSGKVKWESGGNHNVLKKPEREMTQEDFWEFPGYNCRV